MSMNVKDLKEVLADLPDDMPVILSSDSEGNRESYLDGYGVAKFHRDDNYANPHFLRSHHPDDESEYEPEEWAAMEEGLVLWPTL